MAPLDAYRRKRDFGSTPEPPGKSGRKRSERRPRFVVQKHAASRLHYDFRLEIGGALKSWAAPKGIPFKNGERRLAVQVEDHPLEYGDFEGVIDAGNYGAGTVMLWDRGECEFSDPPARGLKQGKLRVALRGEKLQGEWTLIRMRDSDEKKPPGEGKNWLLAKTGGDAKPVSKRMDDRSVLSERTMKQIGDTNDAENQNLEGSHSRFPRKPSDRKSDPQTAPLPSLDFLPQAKAEFVPPMKALLKNRLPKGDEWLYEIKFDGFRVQAVRRTGRVELWSRTRKSLKERFPEVATAFERLPAKGFVIDGEVVALDPKGRPSFQLLQAHRGEKRSKIPLYCYVFDLLFLEGRDLRGQPLEDRKRRLERLLKDAPDALRFSGNIDGRSPEVIREMQRRGLEGLIAKRRSGPYEPDRRSGSWVKCKWAREQEFVVGGYTAPSGSRRRFGAILVGYYEKNRLRFASKVGSGFDSAALKSLHEIFKRLGVEASPFVDLPEPGGRRGRGLTAAQLEKCSWVRPELVAQIRFTEWTDEGRLRQPVFLGLREDKPPREVVREAPVDASP